MYIYIFIEHSILDGQKMIGIHLIWMIKLWFPVEERQKKPPLRKAPKGFQHRDEVWMPIIDPESCLEVAKKGWYHLVYDERFAMENGDLMVINGDLMVINGD